MPDVEQVLSGLRETAVHWGSLAILFHVYFGILAAALVLGARPSKRGAGRLLALPFASVSAVAWAEGNPFNGAVFAGLWVLLLVVSSRLPREKVRTATAALLAPGLLLFLFGWAYPHFLEGASFWTYFYRAPTGLIPCPTLSIIIGLMLLVDSLGSRAWGLILGLAGLFYGATGAFRLGVSIDIVLMLGAALILALSFKKRPRAGGSGD